MKSSKTKKKRESRPSAGPEIIRGLQGFAEAVERGERLEQRFTVRTVRADISPRQWSSEDVRELRASLRVSQGVFAMLLAVSLKTLQAWEQGSKPPLIACRLLECIQSDPARWEGMLHNSSITKAAG